MLVALHADIPAGNGASGQRFIIAKVQHSDGPRDKFGRDVVRRVLLGLETVPHQLVEIARKLVG
jgi:hypothetical protein